jgi:hypothetical protein
MTGKTMSHYLSNVSHERHQQLGPPSSDAVSKFDPFEAATGILVSAKADMSEETFLEAYMQLTKHLLQGDALNSALLAIQRMQLSPSRSVSPGKRKLTSPAATPRIIHQRRVGTIAEELEEAQSNLEYTYTATSMDVDHTKS